MAEVAAALEYLAGGVVGRHVAVRVAPGQPMRAWSDGTAITIDAVADAADAVLVQAALIRCGSLDRRIALRLLGRTRLTRRYLALEAPRTVHALAARMPRRLLAHPAIRDTANPSRSPADSMRLAAGRGALPDAHPLFGAIRPAALLRTAGGIAGQTPQTERTRAAEDDDDDDDDGLTEESQILKHLANPLGGGALGEWLARLMGTGRQRGAHSAGDDAAGGVKMSGATARIAAAGISGNHGARIAESSTVRGAGIAVYRYPEWDDYHHRYRPNWTRVEEFVPWNPHDRIDIAAAIVPPTRAMRRQLARLGLGFDHHRRQPGGDEIVTDDLIRLVIDSRAGHAADPRIYRAMLKTRRDLGVLILLDTSSSVRDASSDGRSIQQQQIAIAWQIAATLDAAGDRLALYGFNSWGRDRVNMLRVKGFDERLGAATAERLAYLAPAGFTRIGAAVRHAGRVIRQQSGMPYRLVVLVTDGFSYDDRYDASYGEADTRRSIAELRADHTACLCLSVGSDARDDKLGRVFGDAAFLRAERPELLPSQLGSLFRRTLATLS